MTSNAIHVRDYKTEIPGELTDDHTEWVFPTVETVISSGKTSQWQAHVRVMNNAREFVPILDEYFENKPMPGLSGWIKIDTGIEGNINKSVPTFVTSGKNIGKASATNVFTQALRDAYGIYNKKTKKSSKLVVMDTVTLFPPMLAQVYKDQKKKPVVSATNPVYIQPKYNGVRCVTMYADSTVIMYSRRKNIYPGFAYIKEDLEGILSEYWTAGRKLYLDGELYSHGVPLQDISGYARREDKSGDARLDYMIYDCFIDGEPLKYSQRKAILDSIFEKHQLVYAKAVETHLITDPGQIEPIYKKFLADGYEGAMIRLDEPYVYSYNEKHSKVLLKMKPTYDAELEITGYTTGTKGKAAGALMIICKSGDKEFPVTPAMEIEDRMALAKKMAVVEPNGNTHFVNHWLGKKIIVEYDEMSKDVIPQRARTRLVVRTWD